MLRKITLSVAIGLFFFVTNTATAQIDRGRFSVHIGPTLPLDDFGDDDFIVDNVLGAGVGLGLGIEYIYPLTETGVGLFFGIDVNYNATTSDIREEVIDFIDDNVSYHHTDEDDITFWKYFNIPISAGLNYTFKADDKLSVYTNLGLVYNFLKITDFTADVPGRGEGTATYDLASSFGVKIGGGIILNDKIYISLNYFGLGKHRIKTEIRSAFDSKDFEELVSFKHKREISTLALTVGFRL